MRNPRRSVIIPRRIGVPRHTMDNAIVEAAVGARQTVLDAAANTSSRAASPGILKRKVRRQSGKRLQNVHLVQCRKNLPRPARRAFVAGMATRAFLLASRRWR